MKIGVLTSSRADYGIYLPLLEKLKNDSFFDLEIIVFGSHLSLLHGYTIDDIIKDDYKKIYTIKSLVDDDSQKGIVVSYGNTILKFSQFWKENSFDLVICLGDRFEMSAAVQASIPFGVKLAHVHGGETTLGAIDNIYRHQISLASKIHFTSTELYKSKVAEILGSEHNIFNVGSLSISNIKDFIPLEKNVFLKKYKINNDPYCLVTFHPETNAFDENIDLALQMRKALEHISNKINVVITMPNADTQGVEFRKQLEYLKRKNKNKVWLIENFGKINYFTAIYYSQFLLGNTSSGIIEAASFNKYFINVGNRQKGRAQNENIINVSFNSNNIIDVFNKYSPFKTYEGSNIYYKESTVENIIKHLKNI